LYCNKEIAYSLNWDIQDGKLSPDTGRLVIYKGFSIKSNGPSMDHNDLITALASSIKESRSNVAGNAYRFYWKPASQGRITVSPVRKIDMDWAQDNQDVFNRIIKDNFG
jgi:hypothetical protein